MSESPDECTRLEDIAATAGPAAMLETLAGTLRDRRRWHALVDVRLMQARLATGLAPAGDAVAVDAADRERYDELALAACREAGLGLLDDRQVAAAWMYLRAAVEPAVVAERLAALAAAACAAAGEGDGDDDDDEPRARLIQEIVGVALWEGVAPDVGIDVILRTQGTCPAITAFDQAVARLPAPRQRAAAARLVAHLHAEVSAGMASDPRRRDAPDAGPIELAAILDAADDLGACGVHCDVSHLQAVLRIARVCDDEGTLRRAWALARYACRLPADVTYPGPAPFTDAGRAARLFYAAQLGRDVEEAVDFFRAAAAEAARVGLGPLAAEMLALVLWRIGRPGEAVAAALARPPDDPAAGEMLPQGALPSLVEMAAAAGDFEPLRAACRAHGDEITFAATLVAEAHQARGHAARGLQAAQAAQDSGR